MVSAGALMGSLNGSRGLVSALELLQEAGVVLGEQTQVVDAVLQIGDALHTHAEGVTSVYVRVDAAGCQIVRVDHAAA